MLIFQIYLDVCAFDTNETKKINIKKHESNLNSAERTYVSPNKGARVL
jgi:hypothetical protein